MDKRKLFEKQYQTANDLVRLLESRGLSMDDKQKAEHYLQYISYYRLSAYMYPFLELPKERHQYKPKASFEKVLRIYRFDKKLRLLIFNEIEKIEVAVRNTIVNAGCEVTGNPFWMTDAMNFLNPRKFQKTIELIKAEVEHSHEDFITHFKKTYSNEYPPAWILSEILPLGVITNIYTNIKNHRIKKRVSQTFGLQVAPFESWMTIIALTRNACCHHARVWNKQNTIRPMLPSKINLPWIDLNTDSLRIYFDLCIIKFFLNTISPNNDMKTKLLSLLSMYPEIDTHAMGFPKGWIDEPLWKK